MADHPNQYAIGQLVLFRTKDSRVPDWTEGTVTTVTAYKEARRKTHTGFYEHATHTEDCDGVYYTITAEIDGLSKDFDTICTCEDSIADTDASGRWRDAPLITTRHQFQLLWADTGGDLRIDSSNTPLEETDIVHLSKGDTRVEVDIHDLLKWAATPGAEA